MAGSSASPHSARRLWFKAGIVWVALSLLLAATFFGAFVHLGAWNLWLALSIAVMKAALVVVIFMELFAATVSPRLAATAGLLWLALMMGLTFADVATRPRLAPGFQPVPAEGVESRSGG